MPYKDKNDSTRYGWGFELACMRHKDTLRTQFKKNEEMICEMVQNFLFVDKQARGGCEEDQTNWERLLDAMEHEEEMFPMHLAGMMVQALIEMSGPVMECTMKMDEAVNEVRWMQDRLFTPMEEMIEETAKDKEVSA